MSTHIEHEVIAEFVGEVVAAGDDCIIVKVGEREVKLPVSSGKVMWDDMLLISIARMTT